MALDDVKQSVEQNLTNAYNKALDKGATEPENKNLENLASTIDSIVGGEVIGYSVKSVINEDGETQTLKITTGGGIQPEGTIVLETNGKHDVSQYEFADVNVPSEEPTLVTKEITENGTYNATDDNADGYSSVVVNIESSGDSGGEEVIVERYTDVTALKNKALELVNANRYCYLRIKGLQEKTVTGKSYAVKQDSVTVVESGFYGIKTSTDVILTPQNINNDIPYIQFKGYHYTCLLNASPTLKYFDIYGSSDGLGAQEWSETVASLISGRYITVDLCYI